MGLNSRSFISSLALAEAGKGLAMEHICSPPAVALKLISAANIAQLEGGYPLDVFKVLQKICARERAET